MSEVASGMMSEAASGMMSEVASGTTPDMTFDMTIENNDIMSNVKMPRSRAVCIGVHF